MDEESEDPITAWIEGDISPAVSEASTLLYEFSRLELRDIESSRKMLWKLTALNHRLGILYADAVELKSEFQTQCDEVYSQLFLMLNSKSFEYRLTVEAAKAGAELGTSNVASLEMLYPKAIQALGLVPGNEPKRKLNQIAATIEKLRSLQRDMTESINGIKHLGNRDLQHAVHGL